AADRTVTVGCDTGPTVAVGGRLVHTSVTATVGELRSGNPVPAQVCPDLPQDTEAFPATEPGAVRPVSLPAGEVDVLVAPTELFFVDRLRLVNTPPAAPTAGAGTRLLTLPLSTNAGWSAHTADGRELRPIVVDGWQQGWLLPADATGPVTISFPIDSWYRLAIGVGLLLLLPLIALAVPRGSRNRPAAPTPGVWSPRILATLGLTAVATLIAGITGTVLTVAGLAALRFLPRIPRRVLAAIAGTGTAVSAAALSTGPWRMPGGYMGDSLWVQFPALVAVVAVGLSALPRIRREPAADDAPPTG
ncbi:MAG: hypothetical protein HOQ36_01115, partial [Nocardia sp.]|nr:hypothetical protein [Nocardia sp.]